MMKQLTTDKLAVLLQGHDISPTSQRLAIARVLFARHAHFTAEDVYLAVRENDQYVSRSTVYNTLGLFARQGLVRVVVVDPQRVFYDSNNTSHHHLYDLATGDLTDIDADEISVSGLPDLPAGAELDGVDVIVRIRKK